MVKSFYVNGTDRIDYLKIETLSIDTETNNWSNLDCVFLDTGGLIRPDLSNEIIYTINERTITVSASASNIVVTSSSAFVPADQGRTIVITGAGVSGGLHTSKIKTFVTASSVELEFAPATSAAGTSARVGERLFAGHVIEAEEQAFFGDSGIEMELTCADWNERVAKQVINSPYASQAANLIVADVHANILAGLGIKLATMATAPTVDAVGFNIAYIDEVLNYLSKLTGWLWIVDHTPCLRFFAPGTVAAPQDITSSIILEGTLRKTRTYSEYRNAQWLWIGGNQIRDLFQAWAGDGSTRNFPINRNDTAIQEVNTPAATIVRVTRLPGPVVTEYPLGNYPADLPQEWTWDATNKEIVHTGGTVLAVGDALDMTLAVQYPIALFESNPTEISSRGPHTRVDKNDSITDPNAGHDYGAALIRRYARVPYHLEFDTYTASYFPGQTANTNLPNRGISNDDYLITSVNAEDDGAGDLRYTIEAIEGDEFQSAWIEFFKEDTSGGSGSVAYTPAPGSSTSTGTPPGSGGGSIVVTAPFRVLLGLNGENSFFRAAVAGTWYDVPSALDWILNPANIPGALTLRCHLRSASTNATITVRYLDTSNVAFVSAESTGVNANAWTHVEVPVTLTPSVAHVYRLQFRVVGLDATTALVGYWKPTLENSL